MNINKTVSDIIQENSIKVTDILSVVAEEICDGYCKWPEQYDNEYKLYDERCNKCPLNKL